MPQDKKTTFWTEVKRSLKPSKSGFPWLRTGYILLGFAAGVLVTSFVDFAALNLGDSTSKETVITTEEDKCQAKGGRYDREASSCLLVAEDRGDSCSDNSDCQGWCLVNDDSEIGTSGTGSCSDDFEVSGCVKFMDNGKVNSICMPG